MIAGTALSEARELLEEGRFPADVEAELVTNGHAPDVAEEAVRLLVDNAEAAEAIPFPELLPLDTPPETPPFPIKTLPPEFRDYAGEIAESVQVPPALPSVAILGAIATAVQRKARVHVGRTHVEPLNLFTILAADPSDRKSETLGKVYAPVYAFQSEAAERMRPDVEAAQNRRDLQTARIEVLKKKAARVKKAEDVPPLIAEIEEAQRNLEAVPTIPRLTAADVTPETLATVMHGNGGRITLADPEGASPLANNLGRYGDTGPNLSNILRGYRGDTMQIDRRGRQETIFEPTLTLSLMVQPGVLLRMGNHPEAREQGLTARICFSLPQTRAGTRTYRNRPISPQSEAEYNGAMRDLLGIPAPDTIDRRPELPEIQLEGEPLQIWIRYHDGIEARMADGGDLAPYRDLAGKFAGHMARLIGLLHMAANHAEVAPWAVPVTVETAVAARLIAEYFEAHGLAAYRLMFEGATEGIPARIVAWMHRYQNDPELNPAFYRADLYRKLRGAADVNKSEDLAPALETLTNRGYLRPIPGDPKEGPGRPSGPRYEINPAVFEGNKVH